MHLVYHRPATAAARKKPATGHTACLSAATATDLRSNQRGCTVWGEGRAHQRLSWQPQRQRSVADLVVKWCGRDKMPA